MEAREYQTLFDGEETHWWLRTLHQVVLDALRQTDLNPSSRILDVGCGTGKMVQILSQTVTPHCYGLDLSKEASAFWARRGLSRVCRASINEIPFPSASFDAITALDVLECQEVSPDHALRECCRVLRRGGIALLVVPAYRWLMSPAHHRSVHAVRRYTRRDLVTLLRNLPVRVIRLTHFFAPLLPVVTLFRLLLIILGGTPSQPRSELYRLPSWVNEPLLKIENGERAVLRRTNLPWGSSILVLLRKTETS